MNISSELVNQFQKVILEKSQNLNNCDSIFTFIHEFIYKNNRGYLIIVGSPGSGKSAILANVVSSNHNPNINIIYYNAQIEGKNRAEKFFKYICAELKKILTSRDWGIVEIPENATEGSWFFSLLLQKVSDKIELTEKLIIVIDALDAINPNHQPIGTNLFYLPRYIPDGIYFILTRRPFKKEQSGLLIEAPSQMINLCEYELKNWDNEEAFAQHWQKMQGEGLSDVDLQVLQVLVSVGKD